MGKMNETGTGFEVKHVRQVMDVMLGFVNLHLGVRPRPGS